ncbi:hypothetical protein [Clostridium sp. E02]|uniref:hypothetical protein n=1 Tax=Clostridium sp. E02 TaxID=2487134 RepID=UPI000F5417C9|nr:hypothetical protein [Clostridium sp. E02]
MKNKYDNCIQKVVIVILALPLIFGGANVAFGREYKMEIRKEYWSKTDQNDGKNQFEEIYKKDGKKYRLESVQIEDVKKVFSGDVITYDSPPFVGGMKGYGPNKELEKEGKKYTLQSSEIIQVTTEETTKYSETSILYRGVEAIDWIPEVAEVQVTNKDLEQTLKVKLPIVDYKEEGTYWDYQFSFPITVTGYRASTYWLGKNQISGSDSLIDHADQFLDYLQLPSRYYEITRVEWNGEPEKRDGDIKRKATAYGRKLVKDIRAVYGGEVKYPPVKAQVYHGIYEEKNSISPTGHYKYKKKATAIYEQVRPNRFWEILKWLQTRTIALMALLLLLSLIITLSKAAKRRKNKLDMT